MRGEVAVERHRLAEAEVNAVDVARLKARLLRGCVLALIELHDTRQRNLVERCALLGGETIVIEERDERDEIGSRGSGGGDSGAKKGRRLIRFVQLRAKCSQRVVVGI